MQLQPKPWERALEREPSRERMSTYRGSDTGGEGPTHTEGAHTEGARHTEGATHTRGATHTGDTQTPKT